MSMPNRTYNSPDYRYGFNGKEKDDSGEFGNLTHYDYGFRIYNPGIGRFLSVDALSPDYPWYTPYQFAGNKPIWAIDLDGLEEFIFQYRRHEDNSVTLIKKIHNLEVTVVAGHGGFSIMKTDKRTGRAFPEEELGMVQYQYFDANNERILERRDFDGGFVDGDNELIAVYDENWWGSTYIGPNNPTVGEDEDDLRREPQDLMDAAARRHDQDYGLVEAAGFHGAVVDKNTIPADIALIQRANMTIKMFEEGAIDPYTGKPVSKKTLKRAKEVSFGFKRLVMKKSRVNTDLHITEDLSPALRKRLKEMLSETKPIDNTPTQPVSFEKKKK